jgi:hypothetical protein
VDRYPLLPIRVVDSSIVGFSHVVTIRSGKTRMACHGPFAAGGRSIVARTSVNAAEGT